MLFPLFKYTNKTKRIFLFIGLLVFGFIFATLLSAAVSIIGGDSISSLNKLRISQISSQLFIFVFPPLLYSFLTRKQPMKSLGFNTIPLEALVGILMMFAILPLNNLLTEWCSMIKLPESLKSIEEFMNRLSEQTLKTSEKMLSVNNIGGLFLNLFMIAGLAAFGEELLFRSMLQTFLTKRCKNVHIGIIITALIFSLVHLEFYGFMARFILGLLLGYMFYLSGTIWIPMLMHFVNNATAVVVYYLDYNGFADIDVDSFGSTHNIFIIIGSILLIIILFWIIIRYHNKKLTEN